MTNYQTLRFTGLVLLLSYGLAAQGPPYSKLSESARRDKIMLWGSQPDAAACQSLQAGLIDPSADIRLRAANALYWKCDRSTTGKTAVKALCRSVELGNAHAGAWLLLSYADAATAIPCLMKPPRSGAMVKLASPNPVPAGLAARVALARLGDAGATAALRKTLENPSLDEALFLLGALREIEDPASLAEAIKLLDDNTRQAPGPDSHTTRAVRNVALEALVARFHLKPSFAVDPVHKYSDAEVAEVRKAATQALAERRG